MFKIIEKFFRGFVEQTPLAWQGDDEDGVEDPGGTWVVGFGQEEGERQGGGQKAETEEADAAAEEGAAAAGRDEVGHP